LASDLETLHQLQQLDFGLREKRIEIEAHEAALVARREKIAQCKTELERFSETRKGLLSERALAERAVAERQDQLRERRQRINRVRNERELHMNEREVKDLGEEIGKSEEALLGIMEQVDQVETEIAARRKEIADLEDADHLQIADAQERVDGLKAELENAKESRDRLAGAIDDRFRRHYENVFSHRGGMAVVAVNGGSCGGCHMRVPSQTLNEIMTTGVIRVCASCQRILYVAPSEE